MAATSNITLDNEWEKITPDTTGEFLVSLQSVGSVEFAVTGTDTPPTVAEGHSLQSGEAPVRVILGDGYLWARKLGNYPAEVVLTVTRIEVQTTLPFLQIATSLISTQTIVAEHHAFA